MNLVTLVVGGTGAVLLYCAFTGQDPRDVVKSALKGQNPSSNPARYATGAAAVPAPYTPPTGPAKPTPAKRKPTQEPPPNVAGV